MEFFPSTVMANKPHGFDLRLNRRLVQGQSMPRKANFERKRLILARKEGMKFLT